LLASQALNGFGAVTSRVRPRFMNHNEAPTLGPERSPWHLRSESAVGPLNSHQSHKPL